MLRVVCGQCGKKLEIPDAWAHNVVKCPQCREPIDLQERDSAECAVKLGQFLNENLGGDPAPGGKLSQPVRPAGPPRPPNPIEVAWTLVQAFVMRHRLVVGLAAGAVLLIVLDTVWLHTGTVTAAALAGGFAAVAAWKSEMTSRLPSAANRAEIEYKVAIGLVALLGLRLAWFCYREITTIVATEDLADVSPAFALLPKWGAILAVVLVAVVPMGAALGSLPLVQRFSIYHVLAGALVLLSFGYGAAEVAVEQTFGVGVDKFVSQQLKPAPAREIASAVFPSDPAANKDVTSTPGTAVGPAEKGVDVNGAPVEGAQSSTASPVAAEPTVVPWTAVPDPPRVKRPKISSRLPAIHFGAQPWNPVTPPVPSSWLVVGDNRLEQSVRQLWDLSRNTRLGELVGLIDFVEPVAASPDVPLIAGYIPGGMLVEVWSLAEAQMIGRLACQGILSGARPFIAFLAPETLLTVYPRGPDPKAAPVCQIWNFTTGEMVGEFAATGATSDPKTQYAISPGRRYLASVDKSKLHVYDLVEKQRVGEASITSVPGTIVLDCVGVVFAPDGKRLTAIFRGDKKARLLEWQMSNGKVVADGEFNSDLAHGAPPDGRPIQVLPEGAGWLAYERVIVPPFSGKQVRAWSISKPAGIGNTSPRVALVLDSSRLLVIADDALRTVKLPPPKQRASNELLTVSDLLNGGPAPPSEKTPGTNQRPLPGAGQNADGGVPERISRAYTREAYIDFLSADDERINEQARWAPWAKRPVFGVRWGVGVLPTNVPAVIADRQLIEPVTGAIGPKLVAALDDRLEENAFGTWPVGEDSRLTRVGWLGIGSRSQLTSSAKRQDIDVVVLVNANWQKGDQRQITVRVADVVNGIVVLNSSTLKTGPVNANSGAKSESIEKWLSDLMRQVDQRMTLQPLPELTAEDAKQAAERLVAAKRHDLAADLVELRIYQARHLIDNDSAAGYYEQLLGSNMGKTFASGDAEERRKIMETVLPEE